jgi:tetratricopeptide (TPR) repeat protein
LTDTALRDARRALKRGDLESAIGLARSVLQGPTPSFAAADALAQLCVDLGLLDDAAHASAQALAFDAAQTPTWRRLATIEMQRRRPTEACAAFEHVLALHPDRAEAHCDYANLLATIGRYDEALAYVERAIALDTGFVNAYVLAALILADRGQCDAALEWLDRAPSKSPPVLAIQAEILIRFERYAEALAGAREAGSKQPDNADAHNCLGIVYSMLQRDEEAIAAFDRAIALDPKNAESLVQKGLILMQRGLKDEGTALFDGALALDPSSANVRYTRAAALDFLLHADEISAMEGSLRSNQARAATDRMYLHFALAGAYLRNSEAAKVFPHLHAGNQIKRSLISYDAGAEERRVTDIIAAFPPSRMTPPEGELGASAIFIVGMPRSGTTLIEQILASHPVVHGAGEVPNLEIVVGRKSTALRRGDPDYIATLPPDDFRAIGREYLARMGPLPNGASRYVDKMLSNRHYAGLIHLALPGARIIHCRRDPLDICLSCYSKLFNAGQLYSYDLVELGRYYRSYERLMAHWRAVLPEDRFFEIDYEGVVENLEETARRLTAFCGLDWSPRCLQFHETVRTVRTASMSQVRQPLYDSSIGRWQQFSAELAPLLQVLGRAA